jgi:membrane carboxypeptidase/penicillin-binding protein
MKKILLIKTFLWLLMGMSVALLLLAPFRALPSAETVWSSPQAETSFIYDRTGTQMLYEIYGDEDRTILTHDEIPDIVRFATIATEDKRFLHHIGVDPVGILRRRWQEARSSARHLNPTPQASPEKNWSPHSATQTNF